MATMSNGFFHLFAKNKQSGTIKDMNTITKEKQGIREKSELEHLKAKAEILDDLIELIEDKYLGRLMKNAEKEKSIALKGAKKLLVE